MKVIAYKKDMVLETNGVCAEGMDIEKLGFIIYAIPLDKVEQAREEIDRHIPKYKGPKWARTTFVDIRDVLRILDKLIAESEN